MIIYEGPSLLDGQQIVVIATGIKSKSSNGKTGGMIQTWILLCDIDPHVRRTNPVRIMPSVGHVRIVAKPQRHWTRCWLSSVPVT